MVAKKGRLCCSFAAFFGRLIRRHLEYLVTGTDAVRYPDADIVAGNRLGHLLVVDLHGIERHGHIGGMPREFQGIPDPDPAIRDLDGGHTRFGKNFTTSPILCSPIADPPSNDDPGQRPVP